MCSQVPCALSPQLVEPYGYRSQGNPTIYPDWDGQGNDKICAEVSGEAGAGVGVVKTGGAVRRDFAGFSLHSLSCATSQAQHGWGA